MALYDVSTSEKKASPALIAGATNFSEMPVGSILPYGGSTLPSGYLLCDGTEVSRTTYAELYSVIGDSFKGNKTPASGNFCLPDLRECTLKGASDTNNDTYTIGTHQKIAVGEFLDDRLQDHTHSAWRTSSSGVNVTGTPTTYHIDGTSGTVNSAYRSGATTEVKSVGVNYIIKAKMVAVPADFMSKVDEAVEDALEIESGVATLESGLSGTITWHKSGRVVDVLFNNVRNESGAIASGAVLATNFPKPLYNTSVFVSRYPNESNVIDIVSGSNPQFKQTDMYNVSQGIGLFGSFTYISAN